MALQVGDQAPAFSLFSSEKKEINLAAHQGKPVVLLFFPLAFTSVCTAELCSVRDELAQYNSAGAQVLAISVDSPQTLAAFKEQQQLNFTLLSDFNKETSRAYGSIYEQFGLNMRGVSKRSAFVVDGAGVIRYAEVLEDAGKVPNLEAVKQTLASLN